LIEKVFLENIYVYSNKDHANFIRLEVLNSPVIKIVIEVTISNLEFKILKDLIIIVNVKSIKYVIILLPG